MSKHFVQDLKYLMIALIFWCARYTIGLFIKRDSNLKVVIGRYFGVFGDNTKYFYIYSILNDRQDQRTVFVTTDRGLESELLSLDAPCEYHFSMASIFTLLRCGIVITDVSEWYRLGIYQLTYGARLVQLWHGTPIKKIELDLTGDYISRIPGLFVPLWRFNKILVGRYPVYDLMVSSSEYFTEKAFSKAFRSNTYVDSGYPRNDVVISPNLICGPARDLYRLNIDASASQLVKKAKAAGKIICLYMPTFRANIQHKCSDELDWRRLSDHAENEGLVFLLKLHPTVSDFDGRDVPDNLIIYRGLSDIYPVLAACDLLITDYSSIFFDFILLDRPIIFFAYDLEIYLASEREMYVEYSEFVPGKICSTQSELELSLNDILANGLDDGFSCKRQHVRNLSHDHLDGQSAQRIYNIITNL